LNVLFVFGVVAVLELGVAVLVVVSDVDAFFSMNRSGATLHVLILLVVEPK
jgi:hypothetical protein